MTAELTSTADAADLIPGDIPALWSAVTAWRGRAQIAGDAMQHLRAQREIEDWTGDAATAYETRVDAIASTWSAQSTAFADGADALSSYAHALTAARARATEAIELWAKAEVAAIFSGATTEEPQSIVPDRSNTPLHAEARAVLGDARASVADAARHLSAALSAATSSPQLGADDWLAMGNGTISTDKLMQALSSRSPEQIDALLHLHPELAQILTSAAPAEVANWWRGLSGENQDALIDVAPAVIGNLEGVAYGARDRANRRWLDQQLAEARAELADAQRPLDGTEHLGRRAQTQGALAATARERIAALENIDAALAAPDGKVRRSLVSLTDDTPPLAAVCIGDLDHADTVTFAVPGMGTTTADMVKWSRAAQNLQSAQDRIDSGTHAVVAWIGYKTPPIPVIGGGLDVMDTKLAEAGGVRLASAIGGVQAVGPEASKNVVGHSYGTTTASFALTDSRVQVDNYVTLGSAGLPSEIDVASDLHAHKVFSGQAQDVWAIDPAPGDQWAWTGRLSPAHPVDPMGAGFGSMRFAVDGGNGMRPVTDHDVETGDGTGYLNSDTESLWNTANATTGHDDAIAPYSAPAPTQFQQGLIAGMTYGN